MQANIIKYNPKDAYNLAKLCSLAYRFNSKTVKDKENNYYLIEVKNNRCLVVYNSEVCILVFPGTDSFEDVVTDLKIKGVSLGDNIYVHKGFLETSRVLIAELSDFFEKNSFLKDRKIWITGHSLGAAQAVLVAYLMSELKDFQGIYSFAQPKIGNKEFCNVASTYFGKRYYRIVNFLDPVPLVPTQNNDFKYEHIKGEKIEYKSSEYIGKNIRIERENIIRSLFLLASYPINHSIDIYIQKAKKDLNN